MKEKSDKAIPQYDPKREQNVLLEKISSDVKTIAEGHSVLNHKIDKLGSDLKEVKSELDTVKAVVIENSRDIKTLKSDVKELKQDRQTVHDHEDRIRKLEAVR